ncbi:MAG: hypothetical protein LBU17_01065 [Treponema sp.]|nr:hypothetical protein [Treponema sp.]
MQYPNTETLNRKKQKRIADIFIRIIALDGEHDYLKENLPTKCRYYAC